MARLRSTSRNDGPFSPPKATSPAATTASNPNKRRTRAESQEVTAAQQALQNVDSVLPTLDEQTEVADEAVNEDDDVSSVLGASSTGSSTKSILDALDRDDIIDNLPDLHFDAVTLISLFERVNDDDLRELCLNPEDARSRLVKYFTKHRARLLDTRATFGTSHRGGRMHWIDPDIITQKLVEQMADAEIVEGPWQPHPVLYQANLALQIVRVLDADNKVRETYVQDAFNSFPQSFCGDGRFDAGYDDDLMWEVYTDILTQQYIIGVETKSGKNHPEFDPDVYLSDVFLDDAKNVKGWPIESTMEGNLRRMDAIRGFFDASKKFVDLEALTAQFSWEDFAVRVTRWSMARKDELEQTIAEVGGVNEISARLANGDLGGLKDLNSPEPELQDDPMEDPAATTPAADDSAEIPSRSSTSESGPSGEQWSVAAKSGSANRAGQSAKKSMPKPAIKEFRQVLQTIQQTPTVPPGDGQDLVAPDGSLLVREEAPRSPSSDRGNAAAPDTNDDQPLGFDDDESEQADPDTIAGATEPDAPEEAEIVLTQQTKTVMDIVREQNRQSDKENAEGSRAKPRSIMDRDPNAVRINWEAHLEAEAMSQAHRSPKRSRTDIVDDSDEDGDHFETDERQAKRPRPTQPARRQDDFNETPHRRVTSSSQPAKTATAPSGSNRQPLGPILSSHRVAPSSSAPARPTSSLPTSSRLPPSHQAPPIHNAQSSPSPSPEPILTQVKLVNTAAKEQTAIRKDLRPHLRPPQIRRAYTEEETHRLMGMIALYQTGWARILKEDNVHEDGPMLQGRSQVQLKDKARNLKMDWLK
jgi:hypothetical protein